MTNLSWTALPTCLIIRGRIQGNSWPGWKNFSTCSTKIMCHIASNQNGRQQFNFRLSSPTTGWRPTRRRGQCSMPSRRRQTTPRSQKSLLSNLNNGNLSNHHSTNSRIPTTEVINRGVNKTTRIFIPKRTLLHPNKAIRSPTRANFTGRKSIPPQRTMIPIMSVRFFNKEHHGTPHECSKCHTSTDLKFVYNFNCYLQ